MTNSSTIIDRPARWSEPFADQPLSDQLIADVLKTPLLANIDSSKFPSRLPLDSILRFDSRIREYKPDEIVVREGDFGTSAFLILDGSLDVVLPPGVPSELLGRLERRKKSLFRVLKDTLIKKKIPELRDPSIYSFMADSKYQIDSGSLGFIQDIPAVINGAGTVSLDEGDIFGELAALGRMPRTATILSKGHATCLEIRWQGLRDLRKFDSGLKQYIDTRYRERALKTHLMQIDLFSGLEESLIEKITNDCQFESYGSFDWHIDYKKYREKGVSGEIKIVQEGDYCDSLILVRAGFVRVSRRMGGGEQTLDYLGAGSYFGLHEIIDAISHPNEAALSYAATLTAVGYVDVIRVPSSSLSADVIQRISAEKLVSSSMLSNRSLQETRLLEWAVDQRLINARKGMVIDLNKCTRCDDCVRACAATHDGNPRFRRQGQIFDSWMVAQACMHCQDPVCLIGCPTGAISRDAQDGSISINDKTCIGCATCANSCPYENIVMVNIRDSQNKLIVDSGSTPVVKATKCDLCQSQPTGPACEYACPHDALKRTNLVSLLNAER